MPAEEIRCLVTGATGYIGGRLVPRLLDAGLRVRAMARNPDKLAEVPWRDDVQVVRGDLGDPDSLTTAFNGMDVVFYLVHSMGTAKDFAAEERRSATNVVAAARRAGVRRLVYLSGLHPPHAELSPHLRSRKEVGDILLDSGIETVVLQAGVVIGSGSASFEMIRHLTDRLPVMTTPRWVHNKIQPIAVGDALHYLTAAATATVPSSRTWDIGGPDVLEYGDMMRVYADVAGLGHRYIVVLPFLTPTIASLWVGTVTPIPPGLARPLIESLECDAVARNHDVDTVIARPPDGLTDYRRAVALALSRTVRGLVEPTWSTLADAPAEPLPSDPKWAGEIIYDMTRSAKTTATPEELWKAVETNASMRRWRVDTRDPARRLRLYTERSASGLSWLDMCISPTAEGSRFEQRLVFCPRGLVGRAYWYSGYALRRSRFRRLFDNIVKKAGRP